MNTPSNLMQAKQLLNHGVVAARMGDRQSALECFDRVLKLAPDYAKGYNNRGIIERRSPILSELFCSIPSI